MKGKRTLLAVVCLLRMAGEGRAHRVDEYLQGTILALEANQARASMRLVPGVQVAASVIAAIDCNGDGVFAQSEQLAYAQRVLADLVIAIDGRRVQPQLVGCSFPEPAELREGRGEIQIEYRVELPPGALHRVLTLENHHLGPASVYLMNAAVPRDRRIRILGQKRNEAQSVYEVDYEQEGTPGHGAA